jgi:hypothetical protein
MKTRLQDWPEQLAAWVEAVRARPFEWGVWDCAIAANDCVQRITGTDVLGGLMWDGLRGALRQLEVEGGLEAAVTERLGAPIAPTFAQRGDVVLIAAAWVPADQAAIGSLGVCLGEVACAPTQSGLAFVPMAGGAACAWKVGR